MARQTSKKTTKKAAPKRKVATKKIVRSQPNKKAIKRTPLGTCFVLMPFEDPFDIYYQKLYRPAIEDANLQPVRADDLFRPSVIVSDLWAMIRQAKVLLAELTSKNANVFYELGLAHAVGKPVVLVSETMTDVPFDLQQLRVLLYDKDDPAWGDKLANNLTSALKETLTAPTEAVPNIFRTRVESQGPKQDATDARLESMERQIGLLRMESRELGRHRSAGVSPIEELKDVTNPEMFEDWVRRWSGVGVSAQRLKKIVENHRGHVPRGEAKRIPAILRRMGRAMKVEE